MALVPHRRSQRSCRFAAASLLSAGSSELTGSLEQSEERASMGAGKRLTLQQLQARVLGIELLTCHRIGSRHTKD